MSIEILTPERLALGFLASDAAKPYLAGEKSLYNCLGAFFAGLALGYELGDVRPVAEAVERIRPRV